MEGHMMRYPAVPGLALLAACYSYQTAGPVDDAAPQIGTRIEVSLTQQGAVSLASELGPSVLTVEGDLLEANPAGLTLAVWQVQDDRKIRSDWKGERVAIPRETIGTVRRRKFAAGATGLLGGLLAGGVFAAYEAFKGSGGATGSPPGGGPGQGQQ
jgi:hypothetical protein